MELKTARFHAFRSMIDKELCFKHRCMGLVGINESGKTNVLRGLSVLSGLHTLSLSDRPKNFKLRYPHISFVFELTANETIGVSDILSLIHI